MHVVKTRPAIECDGARVLAPNLAGRTKRHLVLDDRDIHRALHFAVVEPTVSPLDITLEIVGGLLTANDDRAAECVAAEQRALRPLEHLNTANVVSRNVRPDGRKRRIVEIDDHARRHFAQRQLADTTQSQRDVVLATFGRKRESRCDRLDVADRLNSTALQRFGREGRNRNRYVLQPLLAAAGSDNNIARARRIGIAHPGTCVLCGNGCRNEHCRRQQDAF